MQKTAFLKLPEQGQSFSWIELDQTGEFSGPFEAEFTDIQEHFPNHNLVVFVPAEDVLLTHVELPKMTKSKLRTALSYALEEHLSEDVSSLHFCSGPSSDQHDWPVAVVNVELMGKWFNRSGGWAKNGTNLEAMVPESLLIPWEENTWTLWVESDPILMRMGEFSSFALDRESANDMLLLEFNQATLKPEKLVVYSKKKDDVSTLIQNLPVEIEHKVLEENSLKTMASEFKKGLYINLLQGEFKPKKEVFSPKKIMAITISLCAIWFGVLIVGNSLKYFFLNQHAKQLEQEITVVYKQLFPKATSVISPRKRVERLLNSMRSLQAKGAFLSLVEKAAPVVKEQSGVIIQSVTFADSKAQLQVDVDDFALLDQFTDRLRAVGLRVDQSNATKAGDTIQAKIELKEVS